MRMAPAAKKTYVPQNAHYDDDDDEGLIEELTQQTTAWDMCW